VNKSGSVRCIQCGACIIQCPFDALYFESPKGDIISPDTIRKYKLNLVGKRVSISIMLTFGSLVFSIWRGFGSLGGAGYGTPCPYNSNT